MEWLFTNIQQFQCRHFPGQSIEVCGVLLRVFKLYKMERKRPALKPALLFGWTSAESFRTKSALQKQQPTNGFLFEIPALTHSCHWGPACHWSVFQHHSQTTQPRNRGKKKQVNINPIFLLHQRYGRRGFNPKAEDTEQYQPLHLWWRQQPSFSISQWAGCYIEFFSRQPYCLSSQPCKVCCTCAGAEGHSLNKSIEIKNTLMRTWNQECQARHIRLLQVHMSASKLITSAYKNKHYKYIAT